jgi:hypothetical protein
MTPNCTLRASSDTLRSPPCRVPGGRGYARPSPPHPPHPDQEIVESRWLMGNVKIEGPGTKRAGPTEEGPTGRPTGLRPAGGNLLLPTTTNFKTRFCGLRKIGTIFFPTNLTHARVVHPRGRRPKKKKKITATFSATPRNVGRAPPRQIHKCANMFGS